MRLRQEFLALVGHWFFLPIRGYEVADDLLVGRLLPVFSPNKGL